METKQATVLEETCTYHHGIDQGELTLERVIRYRAAVAIEWIKEDLRRGVQPENIKTFSELHDVVDANMYLLMRTIRYQKPVASINGRNLMRRVSAISSYG